MNPIMIAQMLEALASAASTAYKLYEDSKATMSMEDAAMVHSALLKAQAATDYLRPRVEAELEAASKR